MKIALAATLVIASLAVALPAPVSTPSTNPQPFDMTTSDWRIELVEAFGGSTPPRIALDSNAVPHVAYYPPGRVQYAVRTPAEWTKETVATSPWGGASVYFALGPSDEPHLLYNGYLGINGGPNGVYYAVKKDGNWTFMSRPCGGADVAVDSLGNPGIACWGKTEDGTLYALRYHVLSGPTWTTEYIDTWTALSGSAWISLQLDEDQNPHILYYNAIIGQVRYAYRQDDGTWSVEVVDTIGNIAAVGRQGSLALDRMGNPLAAYSVRVNLTWMEVRYATRHPMGWAFADMGVRSLFPSVAVGPDGHARLAMIVNTPTSYPIGIRHIDYYVLSPDGWQSEVAVDDDGVDMPSMAVDRCGNPHVVYYNQGWSKGVYYATKGNCTSNRPPTANVGGPYAGYEGSPLTLAATASDPDNDPLTYRWDFDNDNVADTPWSSSPTVQHVWGDDFTGEIRVEVSDGKTTSNATATVTVLNLPPRIDSMTATAEATSTLRIAGEKWHDVSVYQMAGGIESLLATLMREPGKPQETSFDVSIDVTKDNYLRIAYTPGDDKVNGQENGATPAWLNLTFDSGPPVEMHHTFNVKHEDTWNWTVSLNQLMAGRDLRFTATATDPGSDDLTFTWEWGDGTPSTAKTYFNDGIGPDPYPSPGGTSPFAATDERTHSYTMAGTYDLKMRVTDDDGEATTLVTVRVIV